MTTIGPNHEPTDDTLVPVDAFEIDPDEDETQALGESVILIVDDNEQIVELLQA